MFWISTLKYSENVGCALKVFEDVTERDVVCWNSIVLVLAKRGEMDSARLLFVEMINWNAVMKNSARLGLDNEFAWNAMTSGYMRNGDVKNARLIFDQMPVKSVDSCNYGDVGEMNSLFYSMPVKNVITWNVMIAGFVQNDKFDQALEFFPRMLIYGERKLGETTLLSVLSACTHLGAHEQGKWVKSYVQKRDIEISNVCGKKIQPDDIIFIAVLSACPHGGLVEEGKRVFSQMVKQFNIVPRTECYGCMIDLLSRAGKLKEAYTLITSMSMKPNKPEVLEVVTKKILQLEPSNPAYLTMISNLNAWIGQWEDVSRVRAAMKECIEKVPGSSSIQVENKVHEFLVKDTKHENRMQIFETLDSLYDHLKTVGIMEKRENVLLNIQGSLRVT
ncbi:hypothetical protein MKW98_026050 [Papaver atlanticum]|uniref:Pentatricopeptide repeat-containing protein n=1 Tax=Papaver atlanticum TaxID=357466 RepID=A0AAD4RYW9_9MAGN|nr:hypothetical protein MKW98_026050 [Papaver atlanticum]